MASIGNIEQFNTSDPAGWPAYKERFEFFLTANDITNDAKKRAVFLSMCGAATYDVLRTLIAPAKVSEKSYDQITTALNDHFAPRKLEIVCRFKFYRRNQQSGESISMFIKELRHLAEDCKFEGALETMIRDRLVCGIGDESLQRRLLAEKNLTFKKAEEICLAHEAASRSLTVLKDSTDGATQPAVETQPRLFKQFSRSERDGATQFGRTGDKWKCFRCDGKHSSETCSFKNARCRFCEKVGHIERVCLSKKRGKRPSQTVHNQTNSNDDTETENNIGDIYSLPLNKVSEYFSCEKYMITVCLNGKPVQMEVDSGAAHSVIGENIFQDIYSRNPPMLNNSGPVLKDYQNNVIATLGVCKVEVGFGEVNAKLPLVVVENDRTSLLGRNWFNALGIFIAGVSTINSNVNYVSEYPEVFDEQLGTYKGPPVSFILDPKVKPVILKARKVPFALKDKIEGELDRLLSQGVLEPIAHPRWCTPIVTVVKNNEEVRICGDYRSTINNALRTDPYPVPWIQNILAALAGGCVFAKLDMQQAYLQLTVDAEAAEAQTIITHKGAFKVNRLQFGVSVAPQIFQRFIDTRLAGIPGVLPYYDDILVVGSSDKDLEAKLREILRRFQEDGLHLRKDKCVFRAEQVTFLGFKISADGIRPTKDKIVAIENAPAPTNKTELQAFLGLINFYHIFLRDKATVAESLHKLLHRDAKWQWGAEHQNAFNKLKSILISEPLLGHYDEKKPLILSCDASCYGVGCLISQPNDQGIEIPVAYHSRTMSPAERNFAQLDREALAIIVGIKKFHDYCYGRKVIIRTDHKPLLGIFNSKKSTPDILSPRMLRWTIILSAYNYDLEYVPGKKLSNADALSRLPLKGVDELVPAMGDVLMLEYVPETILNAKEIANETAKDTILARVLQWAWRGWPEEQKNISAEFMPYWQRRFEISCYQDCLLWGTRVIVPPGGRKRVLDLLHASHPGIVKMKSLARSYVWWPNIDKQIEEKVSLCEQCQENRNMPSRSPVQPWEWARAPWTRLHLDFAGPVNGRYFLIVIDSFSKWLEVKMVAGPSTSCTIKVLRELFATHGLPDVIVSDNGTAFTSEDFKSFLKRNSIRQARVAPYHPSSNGQAERMVQNVKTALKKMEGADIEVTLSRYLLTQHITPHSLTGKAPSVLLMGRKLNTLLDRVVPDFTKSMDMKQDRQRENCKGLRQFDVEDPVYAKSFTQGKKWLPTTIIESTGPLSYKVATPDGKVIRRHSDQLRPRRVEREEITESGTQEEPREEPISESEDPESKTAEVNDESGSMKETFSAEASTAILSRPSRSYRRPKYLGDYETLSVLEGRNVLCMKDGLTEPATLATAVVEDSVRKRLKVH